MPKIKTVHGIENRKVVSQNAWLVARKKLLVKEKKFSKLHDELNLQRRKLPYARGIDLMNTTYNFLDLTAKGRDENPDATQDWVRYHDEY